MELMFVTGNEHKLHEAKTVMKKVKWAVTQADLGYPEIQADTLEEIAHFGINWCIEKLKKPCFIEDAGLFIDALHGFPGPYSKYVFNTIGNEGILRLLDGICNRDAVFKSVVAYNNGSKTHIFAGEAKGQIGSEIKGDGGFCYDPLFIPEESALSFAEMETKEKNALSHRGKSLNKLMNYFREYEYR